MHELGVAVRPHLIRGHDLAATSDGPEALHHGAEINGGEVLGERVGELAAVKVLAAAAV